MIQQKISSRVREILISRLESATSSGLLDVGLPTYAAILASLFPEDFPPTERPMPSPTATAPATEDRISVYAERNEVGWSIFCDLDLDPVDNDRLSLKGRMRNNGACSPKILGWSQLPICGVAKSSDQVCVN